MDNQIHIGYLMNNIEGDILKLPNDPSMNDKWVLIQRLFIVMMKIYNMGTKR